MIKASGLHKSFGQLHAVRGIDLEIQSGETFGLLGANGAGKSTTINLLAGLMQADAGQIVIDGSTDPTRREVRRQIGIAPQSLALYDELSAEENVRFLGKLYGLGGSKLKERIEYALTLSGLVDRRKDPVGQFSGGMKRRLNLAAALVHEPKVLFLDEPTVGVDPQSRNHIFDTVRGLRADGMTVIYTTHYMEEVEALCDRVAIMDHGDIVALGSLGELIAQHAGKGIVLEIAGDADAAARAAEAHGKVTRTGNTLRVEPSAGLGAVIAAIEAAGATIARIESRQANLETAFLAVTGRGLRDEAAA
jgi:ABC-2 type transport system ATP-binding protein